MRLTDYLPHRSPKNVQKLSASYSLGTDRHASSDIAFMRTLGDYFDTAFASCFFCFGLTLFSPVNERSKSFFCGGPTVLRPLAI